MEDKKQEQSEERSFSFWLKRIVEIFHHTQFAIKLVWDTDRRVFVGLVTVTILVGVMPAIIAWVGQQIIDSIVVASQAYQNSKKGEDLSGYYNIALGWIAAEFGLITLLAFVSRLRSLGDDLLSSKLRNQVEILILEKTLELELPQFENSELYDSLSRAYREGAYRTLSQVRKTFSLTENLLALVAYGALLISFSPSAVAILLAAAIPAFLAEAKFASEAYKLFSWQVPQVRERRILRVGGYSR